jgi:uncharacterized protein
MNNPNQYPSGDEQSWAVIAHASSFVGFIFPLGNVLCTLIVWLAKRGQMPYVDEQGKEALNFNITLLLVAISVLIAGVFFSYFHKGAAPLLMMVSLLIILVPWWLICTIVAMVKVSKGAEFRYPLTLRLVQ